MYGIKNAVMTKEHYPDTDVTVYYADIRAFGKGFEEFYESAQTRFGVKFLKGRVGEVVENPTSEDLVIRVEDILHHKVMQVQHDLIVLCPGLQPPKDLEALANQLGVDLSEEGYIQTPQLFSAPVDTKIPGVYVCGCADGPKDIPDSVTAGSAAAMRASIVLAKGGVA
jgi:heterodisulfide reductase subunit A